MQKNLVDSEIEFLKISEISPFPGMKNFLEFFVSFVSSNW